MQMRVVPVFAFAFLFAAPALGDVAGTPTGEGPPNLVVCRAPQFLPGTRLPGPRVCKINAVWAQYRRDGMDVAPDGIHDVASEKHRSLHQASCRPTSPRGGSISNLAQSSLGMTCD